MSSPTQAPARFAEGHVDPAAAFVPVQTRSERLRSYDADAFGAPTGREVNWKHTPLAPLSALLSPEDAPTGVVSFDVDAPEGASVSALTIGASPRGEVFMPEDRIAALAWQHDQTGTHISIGANCELDDPVVITVTSEGGASFSHIVIEAGVNSRAAVVLRHHGAAVLAENVEIIVRDGASLDVITVQQWDDDAVHASSHQARVDRDATLRHVVVSFGGTLTRINPSVELAGAGSRGELYGLSYSDAGQHLESQVYMHHKGPDTRGDVLYKGALQGEGARSVWIGDVLIGADATGTDSYEANRNLVLTEGARADSIPNLEIETGDILGAGHASATGRFDDEQLFYLQARGISEEEARRLVVLGFLVEIVQKIRVETLQAELLSAIEAELEGEVLP